MSGGRGQVGHLTQAKRDCFLWVHGLGRAPQMSHTPTLLTDGPYSSSKKNATFSTWTQEDPHAMPLQPPLLTELNIALTVKNKFSKTI